MVQDQAHARDAPAAMGGAARGKGLCSSIIDTVLPKAGVLVLITWCGVQSDLE